MWTSIEKYSGQKESKCKGPEAREWLLMNKAAQSVWLEWG